MIAVVKENVGRGWQLREIPVPVPAENEVLLKVRAVGICGSDLAIYDGREKDLKLPVVPGHEFAGEIVARGERADRIPDGSRVVVNLVNNCGHCLYCRKGEANRCRNTNLIGFHRDGGFAEYAAVPERNCHLVPEGLSWEAAASVDPLTSALAALAKTGIASSDRVCIIGPGPIGLYACQLARVEGAREIFVLGTRKARLDLARQLGASTTLQVDTAAPMACVPEVMSRTDALGADVVLEASGSPDALDLALAVASKGARVSLVSIYHHRAAIDPMQVVFKELSVVGSYDYCWFDFEQALALIHGGRIKTEPLISHRLPLDQIDRGIDLMEAKTALKVMLTP